MFFYYTAKMNELNTTFLPFPMLRTERLALRIATEADAPALLEMRKSEAAMRYIPRPRAQSLADITVLLNIFNEAIEQGKAINWVICLNKNPDEVIGIIGYVNICQTTKCGEIGYMLHPSYWGNGYVMEAIKEVEHYGFNEIRLNAIEAKIDPRNENSKKILLRNNYSFVRFAHKEMEFGGEQLDTEYYIKYK